MIESSSMMHSIMLYAVAEATATCFALRPKGTKGQVRPAQPRAGQRARAAAALCPLHGPFEGAVFMIMTRQDNSKEMR